jgi:hypothetical protein
MSFTLRRLLFGGALALWGAAVFCYPQTKLLVPMDLEQSDHLKAYGGAYFALERGATVDWLLNYRGGSFLADYSDALVAELNVRGVSFERLSAAQTAELYAVVQSEERNSDVVRLETPPKIAVYVTPGHEPWDDAVTLVLEYAEVPYDEIWIEEVLRGDLDDYDWLHLHHEDFTGQYGKFYASYRNAPWYIQLQALYENEAEKLGFDKVSEMEKAVALTIKEYVGKGGFLFAMCAATDSYDIALAAADADVVDRMYDGDAPDPDAEERLDFKNTFAFTDFTIEMNPMVYEFSDIDVQPNEVGAEQADYFTLFEFSAKYDPVPTMLTQCHVNVVRGFMGQTTMFHKDLVKKSVVVLGEREGTDQVKYLHGNYGRGTFTFYGGHDPEDYRHLVGDPPTDLTLHKNSPGYRLILNNILFPAAKKKKQKT